MNNLKFGIVTSFYNSSKYVDSVIESIKNQTYENWIYFVTDDGSSDDTKQKVLNHCDNIKIFYVEQKFKKEMFWQPQRFVTDDCDFVITMDSDDYVLPDALKTYNHMLNKYQDKNVVFISCDANWCNGDNFDHVLNPTYIHNNQLSSLKDKSPNSFGSFRGIKNIKNLDFYVNKYYSAGNNDILHSSLIKNYGKSLLIKRNLYNYNYRNDSISHKILSKEEWDSTAEIDNIINENIKFKSDFSVNSEFENLFTDFNSFLMCDVNKVGISNLRLNLITKNINKDFDHLKDLYHDHFIDINNFTDEFDYYVINTSDYDFSDLTQLRKIFIYLKSKKYKQICFYNFDYRSIDDIKNNLNNDIEQIKSLLFEYFGSFFWNGYHRHVSFLINDKDYNFINKTSFIIDRSQNFKNTLSLDFNINKPTFEKK